MKELVLFLGVGGAVIVVGCGSSPSTFTDTADSGVGVLRPDAGTSSIGPGGGVGSSGSSGGGTALPPDGDGGMGSLLGDAAYDGATPITMTTGMDPQTCEEAAQSRSYIGCDYWPTVVANNVWSIFDFAVVVANAGQTTANVTVTGPQGTNVSASVPAGQLAKIYLPWVPALKGTDSDNCGVSSPLASSVIAAASAFHLVSSVPVTVYQFNALEYQGQGGPPGKSWAACPGNTTCVPADPTLLPGPVGCFSFSNDASLLLPSTAMTGNYRVAGHSGVVLFNPLSGATSPTGAYMAITATEDATNVLVKVSAQGQISRGTGVAQTAAGGTLNLTLNAGDVAELLSPGGADLSGSLVQASAPVQVITGHPCIQLPPTEPACDHIEESVFPAETMGKDYVVTRPAGPHDAPVPHQVRIYGNVDGTHLTYNPAAPPGCPTTINAGDVVECGTPACPTTIDVTAGMSTCGTTSSDFEVTGDQPFTVGTFTLGAFVVDPPTTAQPNPTYGDPAQSFATAVEQYRSKYVFLAPSDYTVNYVDIVAEAGTTIMLDGQMVTAMAQPIGTSKYTVSRVKLGAGQAGAHTLSADKPVGIQVVGYGAFTSYMYPGGLDLVRIAPPPPPIQ